MEISIKSALCSDLGISLMCVLLPLPHICLQEKISSRVFCIGAINGDIGHTTGK